jgi:hypothetical protein
MPEVVATSISTTTVTTNSVATLDGSTDTFTYSGSNDAVLLVLTNGTGGALSPTLTNSGAATITVPGLADIDASGGTSEIGSIPDGSEVSLRLSIVSSYLKTDGGTTGTVTIGSGTGLEARLLEL